jgi:O-methyltransferase domain/Dimerisation domain
MAIVQIHELPGMTRAQYEQAIRELKLVGSPPGSHLHASGPMEGGWRIVEVWESEDAAGAFYGSELFQQMVRSTGIAAPNITSYPVEIVKQYDRPQPCPRLNRGRQHIFEEARMIAEEPSVAPPPGVALNQMIWGFTVSQAVYVTAKLGIVDVLRHGSASSREIAAATGASEPALRRLLRALTTVAILVEDGDGKFAATAEAELLRSDHPQSLRPWAIFMGSPFIWGPWGALDDAVVTDKPAFDQVYGEPFFTYLGHTPQDAAVFHTAMTSGSSSTLPAILQAYDFSDCTTIVDVGGGHGALLRGILERYPQATGVLFDLLPVVAEAQELKASAVAARCTFVGGDMFRSLPPGGDIYILRAILHDWSDADAIQILRNCRQAIADHGKLLVVESLLTPPNVPDIAKWLDLTMLVLLTGRERSEAGFRELYAAAGFRLTRIIPSGGPAIIEGVPA